MTTKSTLRAYGAGFIVVLSAACSSEPSNEPPVLTDAGDAGDRELPLLPPDCDKAPMATSTGAGALAALAHFENRIRVSGSTIYYHRRGGIHAIQVPGGTGTLLVPYPSLAAGGDAATRLSPFDDFWVEDKSVIGAASGALYGAPLSGGSAELLPGYVAGLSSPWEEDGCHYARGLEHVYRGCRIGESDAAVERLPLSGGPKSTFISLHGSRPSPLVIGGQSLYFVDREEGDDEDTASIFATPLDASAPVPVARHLRRPILHGFLDGHLYFVDESASRAQLWRIRSDSSVEKVNLPDNAVFSPLVEGTRFAGVGGVGYVTAVALYRLPNDAGTTLRDVVLRIRSDTVTAEVAHCFPAWTDVAARVHADFIDLAASDSRLYYAFSLVDHAKSTWEDQILELAP
jgi:hypothetical protein